MHVYVLYAEDPDDDANVFVYQERHDAEAQAQHIANHFYRQYGEEPEKLLWSHTNCQGEDDGGSHLMFVSRDHLNAAFNGQLHMWISHAPVFAKFECEPA